MAGRFARDFPRMLRYALCSLGVWTGCRFFGLLEYFGICVPRRFTRAEAAVGLTQCLLRFWAGAFHCT